MKLIPYLIVLGVVATGLQATAQIAMSVSTDRERYVTYEEILMKVVIRNNSGNVLEFGDGQGYVRLEVQDKRGQRLVPKSRPTVDAQGRANRAVSFNAAGNLSLPPGGSKALIIPVNDFFVMNEEGFYVVSARVGHRRFRDDFVSLPVRFKVHDGVVKWERELGVPSQSETAPIDYRSASILTFQADKTQIYVLRIQDDQYVYSVKRLAPRVSGVEPQIEVDARSHLHFFVQTQPRLFSHWVFDFNGEEKQAAHYVVEEFLPIPRISRDPDIGRVIVVGGRRAEDGVDFNEVTLPTMKVREVDPLKMKSGGH